MEVYFAKKKYIDVMAKRWAEYGGLVVFFDEKEKPIASLPAFDGLVIKDGVNETVFHPEKEKP